MFMLRFLAPLALTLGIVALLLMPWADRLFQSWGEADLQIRSRLVFTSMEDVLSDAMTTDKPQQLTRRLTELAKDERLVGIGYCSDTASLKFKNKDFPTEIKCPATAPKNKPTYKKEFIKGGPVMVAAFPVDIPANNEVAEQHGTLLIIHDMSYVERRNDNTRFYVLVFVLGISLLAAGITMAVARLTLSRWVRGLSEVVRTGKAATGLPRETVRITREIQSKLRQLERARESNAASGDWTPESLFNFVQNSLPSQQIIAISYRQPYTHHEGPGGLEWSTPASGLVTAIEPIMKACKGTWIAVGSSDADKASADRNGCLMVPPDAPSYKLKRLWLTPDEETGFYAGFANEGLWPLCNMAYVKPRFRAPDWQSYQSVNEKFAAAIAAEATTESPIIFIQDYHFGLLPRLLRAKLPKAIIVVFWHIPWPNAETLGILPWREEFLNGLLAADIVGFHTQYFCNNFLDCIDTHIESLIDREHNTVKRGGDFCKIRPYPISIAWPAMADLGVPSVADCRQEVEAAHGIVPGAKIIVGVERLDYIKGIPERLRAFGLFLEENPAWRGKVHFLQIASPSRSIIPAYADIGREVEKIAEQINEKYADGTWTPVLILKQNFGQTDVYKFYRAADVCVVSSLHDGMNLVAKEFVAARDDNCGVLILSQFSGSSRELVDALIVNPYDDVSLSRNIGYALDMGEDEKKTRMAAMRDYVRAHNVFAWAAEILGDAAGLYQRRRLNNLLNKYDG